MEDPDFKDLHASFLSKKPHRTWIKAKKKLGLLCGKQRVLKAPEGYYRCSAWASELYPFPKDISMKTLSSFSEPKGYEGQESSSELSEHYTPLPGEPTVVPVPPAVTMDDISKDILDEHA